MAARPSGDEAEFTYGAVEPIVFDQARPFDGKQLTRIDHAVQRAVPDEILIAPEEMPAFVTDQE